VTTAARVSTRFIRDVREWDALEPEWRELFQTSPTASPPLRWEWVREWWRLYGPACARRSDGLRILAVRRGDRLIGALPLYAAGGLGLRELRFLSTGEAEHEETCAEYLNLLHLPGEAEACIAAMRSELFEGEAWDRLELGAMPEGSPLLALGAATDAAPQKQAPAADLTGGFEAYLGRISSNSRWRARRLLREVESAGAAFDLAADEATSDRFFDDMIALHQERWEAIGKPGCFASKRFTELHRTLHRLWVPRGEAVLGRLSKDGEALAVVSGYIVGDKLDFYVMGTRIDEESPVKSPGLAAHVLLMAHVSERGITTYDFLSGTQRYKQQLATEERALLRLTVNRPGVRHVVRSAADLAGRAARKALALTRR
jgi:CelD/BcsL family acetyltransferase involved in cellulose biosynthesis